MKGLWRSQTDSPRLPAKMQLKRARGIKEACLENALVLNSALRSDYSHTNLHKFHSLNHGLWLQSVISLELVVQADHTEGCCYLIESTQVLHQTDGEWVLRSWDLFTY